MRAWSVLRQLLAATLCAVLALPACSSAGPLSSSTPSHIYDAATLSETRVWGSNEKILLHIRATLLLSEKQHRGCEKCRWKNVVRSVVTYDYDAFGNLIHQTGTTPNNYLFAGEQFDPDLGLYYNRARYLNTSTGRFWSMDTYEGDLQSPSSLHKYVHGWNDPVNHVDRSGHGIEDSLIAAYVYVTITLGPVLNVVSIFTQVTALALVAADAAGYLTADKSLATTYIASGGNPASEIGVLYGEIRTLRTALAISRAERLVALASNSFSQDEVAIINEARQILAAPEIAKIKEAYSAGREMQVVINGRTISYQPGLPFSAMTQFEQRGFVFGDEAFTSDAEFENTVFHELHRLSPLGADLSSPVGGELAEQKTLQAYLFAKRASGTR
jgi:RHS repeat-associated protein